jgi:isoquinoline 1-oxidoreductase beta subunit
MKLRRVTEVRESEISRREFIRKTVNIGTGLTLAISLPSVSESFLHEAPGVASSSDNYMNAFVSIGTDNTVKVIIKHIEFGQGTFTGLATILAEEMDAAWDQIVCESAPSDTARYANLFFGAQMTGGSTAIANSYTQMREAGASARHMLIDAAAIKWGVSREQIIVKDGVLSHPNGLAASFGELSQLAALQPVPKEVNLKDSRNFSLIGKTKLSRKDLGKSDGSAIFTQDLYMEGLLTAMVAHPPRFGAKVASFDGKRAGEVRGVQEIIQIPNGVAVLADSFWSAKQGRDALVITWDYSSAMQEGSVELMRRYKEAAKDEGAVAKALGDNSKGFAGAEKVLEAEYEFPYLAHASMEPMNCVAQMSSDGIEMWYGCQGPTMDQYAVASALGIKPDQVKINTLFAGGSFGRRANKDSDFVVEAALIAKACNSDSPIKLVWTREDDTRSGYFRPMYYHKMKAGLNAEGRIVAWEHKIVGQSIISGTAFEAKAVKNGVDSSSVEGAIELPYDFENFTVRLHTMETQVPVLWWRSVGSSHTAHAVETFMDQLSRTIGLDPLKFRLMHLGADSRYAGVLDLVAEKADWHDDYSGERIKGIAVHKSFGTYVAQVADLERTRSGKYRVKKVVCAVDCGVVINPDIVRAQMEGGIGYGLSPALMSAITIDKGQVVETNFDAHKVLRMQDMPEIETYIVSSSDAPTGVGEPATPVITAAVANALFSKSHVMQSKLPLNLEA